MGKGVESYVHEDESSMNDIEGLVFKWQWLANVHLQKRHVLRKRSTRQTIPSDQKAGEAMGIQGWDPPVGKG